MQGTPPFMAVDVLLNRSTHNVTHDLESVFYVLLFICTHLDGPLGAIRKPPLYGDNGDTKKPYLMKSWINQANFNSLELLGYVKIAQVVLFPDKLLDDISPYFSPLKKHIEGLRKALFTETGPKKSATPREVIEVFKEALLDDELIRAAKADHKSRVFLKRSQPGELITPSNSWDAVKPEESTSESGSKKPKLNLRPTAARSMKVLKKGIKNP
jgi:hypothetical protein